MTAAAVPRPRCDLCRALARGEPLTGDLCETCALELGPEAESLAAELQGRLSLTVPEDAALWGQLVAHLGELALLRRLPAGRLLLARLRGCDALPGPTRGPSCPTRPRGRRHAR